ncbi:MAG: DNA polymerase III subunit gamma/tau [Gammaproteobacteria bacterium]|nr:DNA polymerase III subunit gamma/tau [Gammaproteobacteria bacterium]
MAYEVLARKWRPGSFATMVGQEHVLRALIHALEADRLHHAYLFTGTRGVGKTTVARILARCLNCERGVGPEPCGECSACREIIDGRFVDLIEVDAASRTRVEDTRELLDNVQYAPTRGRYKVYLIDEVHMLSASSFNALLKTLEEPPPHVKFLLATTDPRKLPLTVLSRCLQFHLKNLTPERIVGHLEHVLGEEGIEAESPALWALARAADGSMRDALSLTDQAVAHGGGRLVAGDVARMLGTIDQGALERILDALAAADGPALLECAADLAEHAADFAAVLGDLMSVLHQVAVAQAVPEAVGTTADARTEVVTRTASALSPEDVQLCYQIGLTGIRDLPWAPDPRTGFEMTLLRMLAFRPEVPGPGGGVRARGGEAVDAPAAGAAPAQSGSSPVEERAEATEPQARALGEDGRVAGAVGRIEPATGPGPGSAPRVVRDPPEETAARPDNVTPLHRPASVADRAPPPSGQPVSAETRPAALEVPEDWHRVLPQLGLEGLTGALASNCLPSAIEAGRLHLILDARAETLLADVHIGRLQDALERLHGGHWKVRIEVGDPDGETPARRQERQRDERQQRAVAAIEQDPHVRQLLEVFGGEIQSGSIRPRR